MKLIRKFVLICLVAAYTTFASSAEFSLNVGEGNSADSISIIGEIKPGDYDKFRSFLMESENIWAFANHVLLSSKGGSVSEALKFANLFENAYTKVMVSDECYSACFIMFSGAVDRGIVGHGKIGVHRMSLNNVETDLKKIKDLISPQANSTNSYLAYLGVPSKVIQKMNETPASSLYRWDYFDLKRENLIGLMDYQPIYFDAMEKACGKFPDPYPGIYISEQRRSPEIISATTAWGKCANKIRLKNFSSFLTSEYKLLLRNKTSVLFLPGSLPAVEKILFK